MSFTWKLISKWYLELVYCHLYFLLHENSQIYDKATSVFVLTNPFSSVNMYYSTLIQYMDYAKVDNCRKYKEQNLCRLCHILNFCSFLFSNRKYFEAVWKLLQISQGKNGTCCWMYSLYIKPRHPPPPRVIPRNREISRQTHYNLHTFLAQSHCTISFFNPADQITAPGRCTSYQGRNAYIKS